MRLGLSVIRCCGGHGALLTMSADLVKGEDDVDAAQKGAMASKVPVVMAAEVMARKS